MWSDCIWASLYKSLTSLITIFTQLIIFLLAVLIHQNHYTIDIAAQSVAGLTAANKAKISEHLT